MMNKKTERAGYKKFDWRTLISAFFETMDPHYMDEGINLAFPIDISGKDLKKRLEEMSGFVLPKDYRLAIQAQVEARYNYKAENYEITGVVEQSPLKKPLPNGYIPQLQ